MNRVVLPLALAVLIVAPPAAVEAKPRGINVLLAGGPEQNEIRIWLTPDGRNYVIDSTGPLEAGGAICANPEAMPNELVCAAPLISSFEVNAGGGDDVVTIARGVAAPVTLRGGAGEDRLSGGAGGDKLLGGPGDDSLAGRGGNDWIGGGPGRDSLSGGSGSDVCVGSPREDASIFCESIRQEPSVPAMSIVVPTPPLSRGAFLR